MPNLEPCFTRSLRLPVHVARREKDYRRWCWLGTMLGGLFGVVAMSTFSAWLAAYNKGQDYNAKFKMGGGFGIMMSAWLCT